MDRATRQRWALEWRLMRRKGQRRLAAQLARVRRALVRAEREREQHGQRTFWWNKEGMA